MSTYLVETGVSKVPAKTPETAAKKYLRQIKICPPLDLRVTDEETGEQYYFAVDFKRGEEVYSISPSSAKSR